MFPTVHGHFPLSLGRRKGVMGTVDATAFQVVIMRQNVCFRRQVDICISYLISNHSKHAHGAYKGEVILPSHLWDLCLISCLFVTLKLYTDHSWASSALSMDVCTVYYKNCASMGFCLHGS